MTSSRRSGGPASGGGDKPSSPGGEKPSRRRTDNVSRPPARTAVADAARRTLGLVLIALVVFPAFRLLDRADFMSSLMASSGEANWRFVWGFSFGVWTGVALVSVGLVAWVARGRLSARIAGAGRWLGRPPSSIFAAFAGVLGAVLTVAVVFVVFDQRTILNDASVQLLQARYFAEGRLAGPVLPHPEFWAVQFMVQTAAGWVAQYPPGHPALLAAGFAVGAPWLTMALATGVLGFFLTLSFDRIFVDDPFLADDRVAADRRGLGRCAVLLTVCSPFVLGLAGGYMSHATLAAAAAVALYFGLRAREGGIGWAAAAGAAVGVMTVIRPVSGFLLGLVLTAALWIRAHSRDDLLRRLGAWVAGGAPFAIGFGWFNARFFGGPFTLGYVAASGPDHGLGFHEDPWGRIYTPTAAVGHSSSELLSLSRELLGTPLPIVAIVGIFLLLAPRLSRGERLIVAWAVVPLVASALYWHHDLVFGPRMLGEAAPAWVALAVVAFAGLVRLARGAEESPSPARLWAGDAIVATALAGLAYGAVRGAGERLDTRAGLLGAYPAVDRDRPSLIFIHEPWPDRLGGRLSGRGMRLDSVRSLLTRYRPCQIEAGLLGVGEEEAMPVCRREELSDAAAQVRERGSIGITSLLWLDDLPGLPGDGVLWARDLGPARNAELIAAHPGREPLFLLPGAGADGWDLVPYDQGETILWNPAN
ncbi:MAG: hypothetical protein R3195_11950 [Gemmatimonadota bacterium]|nr:hypothetical protein [Gemmatimonadota bacterium]